MTYDNIQRFRECNHPTNPANQYFDGLVQRCSISIANALGILQSCSLSLRHWWNEMISWNIETEWKNGSKWVKNLWKVHVWTFTIPYYRWKPVNTHSKHNDREVGRCCNNFLLLRGIRQCTYSSSRVSLHLVSWVSLYLIFTDQGNTTHPALLLFIRNSKTVLNRQTSGTDHCRISTLQIQEHEHNISKFTTSRII